jgi:hypothetical protein
MGKEGAVVEMDAIEEQENEEEAADGNEADVDEFIEKAEREMKEKDDESSSMDSFEYVTMDKEEAELKAAKKESEQGLSERMKGKICWVGKKRSHKVQNSKNSSKISNKYFFATCRFFSFI